MADHSQPPQRTNEQAMLSRQADKHVAVMFAIGGGALGFFAGFIVALGFPFGGRRGGIGRQLFGVEFPLEKGPAIVVIALFMIIAAVLSWRAGRRAVTRQLK
jgi:hypothetical protein